MTFSELLMHRVERFSQEVHREDQRHDLRDGVGEPHQLQAVCQAQQVRRGQQHHQLAADGDDQAVHRVADGLKHRAGDDAEAREQVAGGDDAERRHAVAEHRRVRVENAQQLRREHLKEQHAGERDAHGGKHREPDGLLDAVGTARAVIVRDDGHHAVVEAEHRHKDEALELEVRAVHRRRHGGERQQDLVHAEHEERTDALHQNRREADLVDLGGDLPAEAHLRGHEVDV